jgi:hypothetical protein
MLAVEWRREHFLFHLRCDCIEVHVMNTGVSAMGLVSAMVCSKAQLVTFAPSVCRGQTVRKFATLALIALGMDDAMETAHANVTTGLDFKVTSARIVLQISMAKIVPLAASGTRPAVGMEGAIQKAFAHVIEAFEASIVTLAIKICMG